MQPSRRARRVPEKAKPKAKAASGASKPRKAASKAKSPAKASAKPPAGASGSELIDRHIAELDDWRGETLARMRALVLEADPEMTEDAKWIKPTNPWGVAVWSREGIVCTGEVYKSAVKLTFARGASVPDPAGLFNASLEGGTRRAIDVHEGEKVDARAFRALVKAAVAENVKRKAKPAGGAASSKRAATRKTTPALQPDASGVVRLAGGNPQIPKGDGDAPVQAYIAAMPDWKRDVGRRLDALIVREVPKVRKAVRWNSPFYGTPGQGWFLSFHVFTRFVKVTFFDGTSLKPVPPGGTPKSKETRWVDIHEGELDEKQMAAWVKQAAALPGWVT